MIARLRLSSIYLLCIAAVNFPCVAAEIETTFTFGRIEVLKFGQDEWAFLEKGDELTTEDLVRMPPSSLIRLKSNGNLLPTLPGGRELSVGNLIREATQRNNTAPGSRINHEIEHTQVSDILPVGWSSERNTPTHSGDTHRPEYTSDDLGRLRRQLDRLPHHFVQSIPEFVEPLQDSLVESVQRYPYPNIHQAKMLYGVLRSFEREKLSAYNSVLLYAQLLRHYGIGADLFLDSRSELLVVLNSGVPLHSAKRVTANQGLIRTQGNSGSTSKSEFYDGLV